MAFMFRRPLCSGSGLLLGFYAAAVLAVPLLAQDVQTAQTVQTEQTVQTQERSPAEDPARAQDREAAKALAGIWWRYRPEVEGDPVRFYYFHGDGKGLYRYGKAGLTNTHSFDYEVVGGKLLLRFRKSGQRHTVSYRVERAEDGTDWLVLEGDPEEGGATRYHRERPGPIEEHDAAPADAELGPAPAGHMWIDLQRHATGGSEFHFYQLRPAGIDGRGVGWFHRGDFDDWSTESLTYRITGNILELNFSLAGTREVTRFEVKGKGDHRTLHLQADPRDFWHAHTYRDAGPSFGTATMTIPTLELARSPD